MAAFLTEEFTEKRRCARCNLQPVRVYISQSRRVFQTRVSDTCFRHVFQTRIHAAAVSFHSDVLRDCQHREAPAIFIVLNTKFLVLNTQFLVFNTHLFPHFQ